MAPDGESAAEEGEGVAGGRRRTWSRWPRLLISAAISRSVAIRSGGDRGDGREAERVETGTGGHVAAGAAGARVIGERRGDRDQRDAPLRRLKEFRFARLREALAHAGLHQPRFGDVLRRQVHAEHAVVAGVVVGPRDQVETGPDQLFGQRRLAAHVGAAALVHGVRLVVVKEHLEIGEGDVRAADRGRESLVNAGSA